MSETLIINGLVIDPASGLEAERHIAIRDGRISEVSSQPFPPGRLAAADVVDAAGCWVMPGLIDLHVHLREPGEEYKETIASGLSAAVAGGFTAVVSMPNTKPVNDNAAITELILRRAKEANLARVHPAGAISKGLKGEEMAEIGEMVAAGCCAVTDDGKPVSNAALMRRTLEYTRIFDIPVSAHEENLQLVGKGVMNFGPVATRLGMRGIPAAAEEAMVARDLSLAELTGGRLHIAHVSCAGSVRMIREAKQRGLKVTAEVTPHHFTLTDEACTGFDTNTKMNPPLRAEADRQALIEGLADGTIDAIATDHAPHSVIEKEDLEFDIASNGIIGLETSLALALELVRKGAISKMRLAELMSAAPARIFRLPGGSLAVGAVGDVTVVAPNEEWVCEPACLRSKSKNTPFVGWKLKGRAKATVVGGRVVYRS